MVEVRLGYQSELFPSLFFEFQFLNVFFKAIKNGIFGVLENDLINMKFKIKIGTVLEGTFKDNMFEFGENWYKT